MDSPSTSQAADTDGEENDVIVKCRYMSLLDEVENIENKSVHQNICQLNNVIDQANKLFPQVNKPSQLYWDAKVLHCSSATLEDTCNNLDVGEGNFKLFTFAEQMKAKSLNNEGHPSWEVLAAVAQPVVHNSLPWWSPLLGSFEYQTEVPLSQRKERKQRVQKEAVADKKEPEKLKKVDKTREGIEEIVQNIYTKLKSYFKSNGKKPISYFKFVIDPNSFSSTVENIFHVSFLINDGHVKMDLDDDDEPIIFPVSKGKENANPETDRHTNERLQNIFSIDMKTWKDLITVQNITSSMI